MTSLYKNRSSYVCWYSIAIHWLPIFLRPTLTFSRPRKAATRLEARQLERRVGPHDYGTTFMTSETGNNSPMLRHLGGGGSLDAPNLRAKQRDTLVTGLTSTDETNRVGLLF